MADRRQSQAGRVHYIHSLSYTTRERVVGVFVIGALAVLLGMIAASKDVARVFQERVVYYAYVESATGISTDTEVWVDGFQVGEVESFDVTDDNRIRISLAIIEEFRTLITVDATVTIAAPNPLAPAVIDIAGGSSSVPMPPGANLPVQQRVAFDEMLTNMLNAVEALSQTLTQVNTLTSAIDPDDVGAIASNLSDTMAEVASMTGRVSAGEGALGAVMFDEQFEDETLEAMDTLNATLDETHRRLQQLGPIFDAGEDLANSSNDALAGLPQLLEETTALIGQLNQTMLTVNSEMEAFPDLVLRTRLLMDQMDETLIAIQSTWPISDNVPPPEEEELVELAPPND